MSDATRKTYARRPGDDKQCAGCGGDMARPLHWSPSVWSRTRFCSMSCAKRHTQKSDMSDRFNRNVHKAASGCWEWTGTRNKGGYGQVKINGRLWLAHRLALHLAGRPVPDDRFACHHCDNRGCVNPDHIFIGTADDNNKDAAAKGRFVRGDRHPNAKMSDAQVAAARRSGMHAREMARRFGISGGTARKIVRGLTRRTAG